MIIDRIKQIVAEKAGISIEDMIDKNRLTTIVEARYICYQIIRENSSLSLKQIGSHFGNRDHTTIINGLRKHDDLMNYPGNNAYKYLYLECKKAINSELSRHVHEPIINAS